jgi:hypothetical protein
MNAAAIDAVIAELRLVHPELQQPLTWEAMTAILHREGIVLLKIPLTHDAQVISADGISIIAINSNASPRRHTYYAAHEYAHVHLHFQEAHEVVYHTSACWPDDPREDDAEYMATMLLLGPQRPGIGETKRAHHQGRDFGDSEPVIPRPRKKPSAPQPSLPLPLESPLPYGQSAQRSGSGADDALQALLKRHSPGLRAKLAARDRADKQRREVSMDITPRLEYEPDGRKHYFVDRGGERWRVYDMLPGRKSATLTAVEPPHNWATERVFVRADGARRQYVFAFREDHILRVTELEQQLRRSHDA